MVPVVTQLLCASCVLNLVGHALACRCSVLHKQVKKLDLEHRRVPQLCVNSLGFNKFGPLTWQRACAAAG